MARRVGNDGDINRLNETTHYAGAADFVISFVMRPGLLLPRRVSHILPPLDAIVPTETWELVEQLLVARPPVAAQQAARRKESFTLKLVWLRDRARQMHQTDDPETLRQYTRCYIMLLIGGYLMTDKSNNLVHLRWLPLLRDFTKCRAFSWGSLFLSLAAQQGVTDITGCTPMLMSWIYQRFLQWCPGRRLCLVDTTGGIFDRSRT
ncbi:hypothetical protein Ahy_A08g039520 [Arachis hypogaea]|uniref:Aminotransferase-like plant mobile domain-containing protein n=1 Tax=Arachis hypogaea TaxID=3818 RepID=A0A445BX04_ARAHY|nr:hypothetical protein Ahy_A08g039520 [Arachis hypogaea]